MILDKPIPPNVSDNRSSFDRRENEFGKMPS